MNGSADEHMTLIGESRLTEWDCTFLDSIRHRLELGVALSPKQSEMLDEIWERATARG